MSFTVDFVRLMGILMLWAVYPQALARDPRFESGGTTVGIDLIPALLDLSRNVKVSASIVEPPVPSPAQAPAPAPAPARKLRNPRPHGNKSHPNHVKKVKMGNARKMDNAKKVGFLFGGIAGLLQVAVVVFLWVKRKQMIGLVKEYDGTHVDLHGAQSGGSQGHWNGLYP